MLPQDAPLVKRPPIYLADPAPPRRALPIAQVVGLLASLALAVLGYHLTEPVLAAVGCAVAFAQVWRPTRVRTTERLYRVCGVVLRGDEETDAYFDERK